ncbi:MAG: M3 family metallopeptidase, partial [Caulobacterales bacterium]
VYVAFRNRAWPRNEPVLRDLLQRRYQLAQTLGYQNYAVMITEDKMIGSPARASAFIDQLSNLARPAAQRDYGVLLNRLQEINRRARAVPAWDTSYLTQLVQTEDYALNPQEVRQYFAYNNVRDGILQLTEDLFRVDIRPWRDAPKWDPSVEAYELYDGGRLIGRFYLDMHPRDGKYSHAAQFTIRNGIQGRAVPVAALICNFPTGGHDTGLMEHSDVETFLHEFGHLLHNVFSGRVPYAAANMGEIEWDFIEAPSQLLEEWVWDYETLRRFAVNAQGQPIPQDLVARMNRARFFGEGVGVMTQLGYANVSLGFYNRNPSGMDLNTAYTTGFERYAVVDVAPGTHMYASFGHLDGYSAIYYTYQWSRAIAFDLFTAFETSGLRDAATAQRYRETVLAPGGSAPANTLITRFLGRPSNVDAYARRLRE